MFPKFLLRRKVGQALVVLGLCSSIVCIWLSQQDWDRTDRSQMRRPRRSPVKEDYVIVNNLLDEIRGGVVAQEVTEKPNLPVAPEDDLNPKEYNDPDAEGARGAPSPVKVSKPTAAQNRTNAQRPSNERKRAGTGVVEPCPLYPTDDLIGRLAGLKECVAPEDLPRLHPYVEKGGRVRPTNCTAYERVAIIIPFRNRYVHLYILLNNIIPMMQRQKVDARFFVIEQAPPTIFNRAALFNVGFIEALKLDSFDCFIFHDVDLIPLNDRNLYRCDEHPMHFAVAMDKYEYKLPYKKYVGGVVGFTKEQYLRINGNSNLYFGWGGEDDDLFERIDNKEYEIARPYLDVGKYDMVRHKQDKGNEDNCDRRRLLRTARQRQDTEGLNTIKYKRKSVELRSHMTWITVQLDMAEILATAPEETRKDMELTHSDVKNNFCNFSRGAPIHE
ncbi:unnamed protein product [Lymnaea stagnalis]|uniref:Beta-1,4-galactosyltransferase n=1 Tax=Lymnaea stagnalis TaxID=6523 RepID=A0AAV2HE71_LYMST